MSFILNNTSFTLTNGSYFSYDGYAITSSGIVTTNLTHLFDAGNVSSYGGSGAVWTNLVGSNNLALVNSPTFVSSGTSSRFVFNGTNQWTSGSGYLGDASDRRTFTMNFILSFGPLPFTFGDVRFFADNQNPTILIVGSSTNVNTVNYTKFSQGATNFFVDLSTNSSLNSGTNYMMTYVSTPTNVSLYINGAYVTASTEPFVATQTMNDATRVYGYAVDNSRATFVSMSIAHIMFYSSSLSAADVTQNYNVLKSRYGI